VKGAISNSQNLSTLPLVGKVFIIGRFISYRYTWNLIFNFEPDIIRVMSTVKEDKNSNPFKEEK